MKQKPVRRSILSVLALVIALLTAIPTQVAVAAESIPELQWPAVDIGHRDAPLVESPAGSITLACTSIDGGQDLVTYDSNGQLIRQLNRSTTIDGISNCIGNPIVDKNEFLYGIPAGFVNGSYTRGPNLLAYEGNSLKWKYPLACGSTTSPSIVSGADGNIYATVRLSDGVHLIGLNPKPVVGQLQPDKIVDVKIPNDCSIQLYAFKDGIMLHGQSSGQPLFYSYSGKKIGEAPVGDVWYEKLNAEGQLFIGKYSSGSYTSASVVMYNYRNGETWTTLASTAGANVNDIQVYPLPGGSVVARIHEQKMTSDGIPALPKETIHTLVTINPGGVVTGRTHLTNSFAQNGVTGKFTDTLLSADSTGKVAVVRDLYLDTGVSWPKTVPAIAISVYNPANQAWTYQTVMQGDLGRSGGPSGYSLQYAHFAHAMAITSNSVSLIASCANNCLNSTPKLYSIKVAGIGVEYPRGVVQTRMPRASALYIALGDSFSSNEGVEPFEPGTNIPNVNLCHRSTHTYPKLIAGSSPNIPSLGNDGFRACSGAVTDNVWAKPQWNESIQLDLWPDVTTQIVTITIGGNDIRFSDFSKDCFYGTCEIGSSAYNASLNAINNELPAKLEATYKAILRYTPNAKIYVLGYPQVMANKMTSEPFDSRCFYMHDGSAAWADAQAARDIVSKLNAKIKATVNEVRALESGNLRLKYVPLDEPGSPFIGHELCSSGVSWFQNVDQALNNPAYVFHPNSLGAEGYATVAGAAINNN